jgi:hypothetical protein
MTDQLQLDLGKLDQVDNDTLAAFAKEHLATMREEALAAKEKTESAFLRAWQVGKACATIGDRLGPAQFEEFAKANISADYFAVYRCTTLALMSPDKPPLRGSAQYKQLQIAFGNEPPPKTTPRKTDTHKFSNFKAAVTAIRRWWREGDGIKGLDNESLREIRDDLKPIVDIYENIQLRLSAE